jgi:hypothetical protein
MCIRKGTAGSNPALSAKTDLAKWSFGCGLLRLVLAGCEPDRPGDAQWTQRAAPTAGANRRPRDIPRCRASCKSLGGDHEASKERSGRRPRAPQGIPPLSASKGRQNWECWLARQTARHTPPFGRRGWLLMGMWWIGSLSRRSQRGIWMDPLFNRRAREPVFGSWGRRTPWYGAGCI